MDVRQTISKLIQFIKRLFSRQSMTFYDYEFTFRERVQKILAYYDGQQIDYLMSVLNSQFSNPTALKLQPRIANITRYITNNLCMLFSKGVLVKPINEKDAEIYDDIVDSSQLDATMQEVERKTFLTKTSLIKVSWRDEKIALDVITPEYLMVTTSDENPYRPESIIYPIKLDDKNLYNPKGTFGYWSETEFKLLDESGRELPNPQNEGNVNPYGVLPFVVVRNSIPTNGEFYNKLGEELINAQESINVLLTEHAQLVKMQSFSIPVLKNPKADYQGNVNVQIDPSKPIIVEDNKDAQGDFKYVTPDAKLSEVQESIDKEVTRIGALFGVNVSDFVASGQKSSADATKEYNASINEYREQQKLIYLPILSELFEIIRIVWNTHSTEQLSEDGVTVQILDPKRGYTSVDDKIKETDYLLGKNFISLPEALTMWSDDLTEDEAKERIKQNQIVNEEITKVEDTEENKLEDEQTKMDLPQNNENKSEENVNLV